MHVPTQCIFSLYWRREGLRSFSINDTSGGEDSEHNPLILQAKLLNCPCVFSVDLSKHLSVFMTHTETHRIKARRDFMSTRLPYLEWFWASSGPLESHQTKKKRRRRKKTHWCIYRKMRPHNTLFGERIIMEPRCSGACVPVFWFTLSKQAGPGMNQGGDTGLALWNTDRLHSLTIHTLCLQERSSKNGATLNVSSLQFDVGLQVSTGEFEKTDWILDR